MSRFLNKLLSLLVPRHREYLLINRDGKILETSPGVKRFAEDSDQVRQGQNICLGFPELIGLETILIDILDERQDNFELKGISRCSVTGESLYFDLYVIKHPLAFDQYNPDKPNQLIILLEDVTERMVLEQTLVQATNETRLLLSRLSASKGYIDQIITAMADALLVTKPTGTIKTVNRSAQNLFGYDESELVGNSMRLILSLADDLLAEHQQQLCVEQKFINNWEVVCQKKTGEKIMVSFSCSAIQMETESSLHFIYIGRDITERQRTQKRIATQHAISRILSDSGTIEEAMPKILPAIGETLVWDLGELWISEVIGDREIDRITPQLRCEHTWVSHAIPESMSITQPLIASPKGGLLGQIWTSRSPKWISGITSESLSPILPIAELRSAFGFPIQDDEQILGVITFYSYDVQPPDPELTQVMATIGNQLGQFIKRKQAEAALRQEQEKSEQLLLNILPEPIVDRLKHEHQIIAEDFAEVSVLFADIVGFTQLSSSMPPITLLNLLNQIFSIFDELCEQHQLEKIKTIGDAYMVVGGLPRSPLNHAHAIARMALDMQAAIAQFRDQTGQAFNMRIGINTGPVVAGVIGLKKFSYDLWGDTVNIASRMESQSIPGRIQVTAAIYEKLKDTFEFEQRGMIDVKGRGKMTTYFLIAVK
ncbi:PAS fold family [Coleofasciculus chthonoplastes PCC 7420]|uniref:Adenylate cyclase n=1 Tax=Coleofasciculus chthonoplastes PCC 7420 TaxID=118168 RepID=B4VQ06_9CYAN|nr:adenylate/guanylate cyclase domain-containing protein [Coleofasciculus chthonoplastes]EDX76069.1 PAS fold family [Coleofasciculus chthonoplastes PCC 7420]